jgi:hypothetical protein
MDPIRPITRRDPSVSRVDALDAAMPARRLLSPAEREEARKRREEARKRVAERAGKKSPQVRP